MGLMDRDYYREKKPERGGAQDLLEKLKKNPLGVIAILVLLAFLIAMVL